MLRPKLGILVTVVAMCGAAVYLAAAGLRNGWVYYVGVDEALSGAVAPDRPVRVHGVVADEGLDVRSAEMSARFRLIGAKGQLEVVYLGVVPDRLSAGREVVAEGTLSGGVLKASSVLTKCASRYTAKPAGADEPSARAEP